MSFDSAARPIGKLESRFISFSDSFFAISEELSSSCTAGELLVLLLSTSLSLLKSGVEGRGFV